MPFRPVLTCATNTKKLASGYALDRIMPRCKLFIGFIMICATNTENWRVAMCEASLAIYSSFGLRPLGALCYELCDQHRKLASRYVRGLVGHLFVLWPKAIRRALLWIVRPTQKTGVSKVYIRPWRQRTNRLCCYVGDQHRKLAESYAQFHSAYQPTEKMCGGSVISLSVSRLGDQL